MMTTTRRSWNVNFVEPARALAGLLSMAVSLASCAHLTAHDQLAAEQAGRKSLEAKYEELNRKYKTILHRNQRLEAVAGRQIASTQGLEDQLALYKLQALDREHRLQVLSKKLDEAILEVVRTMAKLRSLESKAEAASNLAETEIAVDLFRRGQANRDQKLEITQAVDLLELGAKEFKKQNYGGAVYLTTQAKNLIKGQQARSQERDNMTEVDGESVFALPLPLRTLAKSNIREGPTTDSQVLFTLDEQAPVTGHSFKGAWVRIKSEDGKVGWIFYELVGPQ